VPATDTIVPLVPRQRLVGLSFGGLTSVRRGQGSDVAGSRPYQPGDDVDAIDWAASARLSSAHGTDEFIVREKFAEEAPHVVVVADRRPEMEAYPAHLPWLSKPLAMRHATEIIFDSALAIRGVAIDLDERTRYNAPPDNIEQALLHLVEHRRSLPVGSFVFILSDFLGGIGGDSWTRVLLQRWDVVPVVVQDPVWEQSFPPIGGAVVPFWDPKTKRVLPIRMSAAQADEQRERNERRFARLLDDLRTIDVEPVVLSSHAKEDVLIEFLDWAELRRLWRGRRW
jgi:hypothetical protein